VSDERPPAARRARAVLVVAAVVALLAGTGVALSRIQVRGDLWLARRLGVDEPARELGRRSTELECVVEGVSQAGRCSSSSVACMTATNLFTSVCMEEARPSPELCTPVPDPLQVIRSARWQKDWCAEAGSPGEACVAIARTVQRRCYP